jgi:hypothetical protein
MANGCPVTAVGADVLQSLTSFTVTASYHRHETTFDVRQAGQRDPVARLHKPGPYLKREPYQLLTGPQLAEPAGKVSGTGAVTADGSSIGTVGRSVSRVDRIAQGSTASLRARRWQVEQAGMPPMTGRPAGLLTRLRFNTVTDLLLNSDALVGHNPIDYVLPFTFRFSSLQSMAFEVRRKAGRGSYAVSVRDPRVDRRLVLACVLSINALHAPGLRREAADLTTNPFRR